MLSLINDQQSLNSRFQQRRKALTVDESVVKEVLRRVRTEGDRAIREFSQKYDDVEITEVQVPEEQLKKAETTLDSNLLTAIDQASENIRKFHELQRPQGYTLEQADGTRVDFRWRSMERVGVYIPGGRFPLFSTVLMNVIPAQVAGVQEIVVCTPPGKNRWPAATILATCFMLGLTEVYRVGGIQAIGALAFGTESIPPVDKITGPGSAFVTAAKQAVSAFVGIDMTAGPTELVIIADDNADSLRVAVELISQAEHDPQAWPVLLTDSKIVVEQVNDSIRKLLADLPKSSVAQQALQAQGFIYLAEDLAECIQIADNMAPEHLLLMIENPEQWIDRLKAGAIFIGPDSPVAWGDYWAGPNHILPTSGQARFRGPLSVLDFMVPYSVIKAGEQPLSISGKKVIQLASAEGLAGHALSVALRRKNV